MKNRYLRNERHERIQRIIQVHAPRLTQAAKAYEEDTRRAPEVELQATASVRYRIRLWLRAYANSRRPAIWRGKEPCSRTRNHRSALAEAGSKIRIEAQGRDLTMKMGVDWATGEDFTALIFASTNGEGVTTIHKTLTLSKEELSLMRHAFEERPLPGSLDKRKGMLAISLMDQLIDAADRNDCRSCGKVFHSTLDVWRNSMDQSI